VTFLAPERLWFLLLIPALVALYVVLQRRRSHYAVRFTNLSLLDTVAPRRVNWRQHVAVLLALLTLAGAVVLFAKPSGLVKVPRTTSVTVVLTIDVSLSMEAQDVDPDRITAAKQTAKQFLDKLPDDYRVSLVSFARYADVVVAPTTNHTKVATAIDQLQLQEYTATGEGIFAALDVVKQSLGDSVSGPGSKLPAMIVLISDGKRTVGRSQVAAARAARAQGVPIYTVALGTAQGVILNDGHQIRVTVEIGELRQIAQISGGKAYVAATPDDLLDAYRDVDGRLVYETERTDVTSRYLGWLVLLSLLSTGSGLFVASRWP
jgi:Ca-activated chloride channel family protein